MDSVGFTLQLNLSLRQHRLKGQKRPPSLKTAAFFVVVRPDDRKFSPYGRLEQADGWLSSLENGPECFQEPCSGEWEG